jgi:hypothetical protein
MYISKVVDGRGVVYSNIHGDDVCYCDAAAVEQAAKLLNRQDHLQHTKRQYTAAARVSAQIEALPGFSWPKGQL